ncbi:D-arabinono-1,4-lactone oxidase [uncultured Amnibacterium sp.]|uniref:D-arabinono-1,4-lactone oxidase n=1 Tax=uncultured Amnibacterium sp. TaxID=1631851 RepID=UPI0035CC3310
MVSKPPLTVHRNRPWTNWGGNIRASPSWTVRPTTESQVVDAVRHAVSNQVPIRAGGSAHSFSPLVATEGLLIDMTGYSGVIGIDASTARVRVRGGTLLRDLGEPLWKAGFSLRNQGDIDRQTIAGAVATATHGSGVRLGSVSSCVRAVRIVDGTGSVRDIDAATDGGGDALLAAQVSLGLLGIVLEVELEVDPAYLLEERISFPLWEETVETWDEDVTANRHYSFLWCHHADSAGLYELPVPDGVDAVGRSFTKRYRVVTDEEATASRARGTRADRAYRIYPGTFDLPFHEMECFVPADRGREAVEAVRELIVRRHPEQRYPVEVRWVQAEAAFLSPASGRDSTVISVSGAPRDDYSDYFADVDRALAPFDARSHWGKLHRMTRDRVEASYPQLDRFDRVRREMDPADLFLNDHLRPLFG